MSSDGGHPRPTGVSPGGRAAWLPDSRGLVIYRPGRCVRLDVASGQTAPVLENVEAMPFFAVSADGRWLAGQSTPNESVDTLVAPLDGSAAPHVVVEPPAEDYHPFFSPDGRRLYYQTHHENLFRVPGPAQGWRRAAPEPVTRFPERGLYLEEPQVSRDGRTPVYARVSILGDLWLLRLTPGPATP